MQPSETEALDNQIEDFRNENKDALLDAGHSGHHRAVKELTAMYERRFADEANQPDPGGAGERPADGVDEIAADVMEPMPAGEFPIGQESNFGANVDQQRFGWDHELEGSARHTFEAARLNEGEALNVAEAYKETLDPERYNRDEAHAQTTRMLADEYGADRVDEVIAATNRMLKTFAPPEVYKFIGSSGLGVNPRFATAAVRFAKQRGFFR
jgi:hypothetical protein